MYIEALVSEPIEPIQSDERPFLQIMVNGKNIRWLIDTGAASTVMDYQLFLDTFGDRVSLTTATKTLRSATGHTLDLKGKFPAKFVLQGRTIAHEVLVVNTLKSGAILGADFLTRHGAGIDMKTGSISFIEPVEHPPTTSGEQAPEQASVYAAEEMYLPSRTIIPIKLKIRTGRGQPVRPLTTGFIEENWRKHQDHQATALLEAICVTDSDSNINAGLMNAGFTEVRIPKGQLIGSFNPISPGECFPIEELRLPPTSADDNKPIPAEKQMAIQQLVVGGPTWFQIDLKAILCQYHMVISKDPYDLGRTEVMPHQLQLKTPDPVHVKQFRIPWEHRQFLDDFVTELLKKGCIQESRSPFNAPIFCVKKPHGQGLRVVQDFRFLNFATMEDKYIMREIQDCIDQIGLRRSCVFSTIDLTSGFWQQVLHPESRPYTAFTVPGRGRFEWISMPMGLHGAPSSFARLMDHIMTGIPGVLTYLDDVLIHSPDYSTHLQDLTQCLTRLKQFGLKVNLKKCAFAAEKISYLGFTLTPQGVLPGQEKLTAVAQFPEPNTVKQIREFTGLANYFRHMIPNYALIAGHLSALTRKDTEWKGGPLPEKAHQAFKSLQKALCQAPILAFPRPDRPMTLATDASTGDKDHPGGLGAVLTQTDEDGQERVIAYASRTLKEHEKNYGAYLLELAAASWGIDHFSVYLAGRRFRLLTDHKPLTGLNTRQTKTLNRLQQQLSEFDFIIEYREGTLNQVPDALSRNPIDEIDSTHTPDPETTPLGITTSHLRKCQSADPQCALVIAFLEQGLLPDEPKAANWTRRLAAHCLLEDTILHFYPDQRTHRTGVPLLWVPQIYQRMLLKAAHCHRFAGHGGQAKTLARLRSKYFWPGIAAHADTFVKQCPECQKAKLPSKRSKPDAPLQAWDVPSSPNQRIHIDLMGPLKTSESGRKYILVITDAFTKYAVVKAIPNKEANTVALAIFEEWIARFSCPKTIVSDNGREFCSKLSDELFKNLGIDRKLTSTHHPQTNSAAESFNRSIIKYMKTILDNATLDWEKWLAPMMLSYNTQVHKSTNLSPFFLTYQMDPSLPHFDLDYPKPVYRDDWATESFLRARKAWETARIQLIKTQNSMLATENNERRRLQTLQIGTKVLVNLPNTQQNQNPKFLHPFVGGFVVIAPLGPVTYALYNERTRRISHVHVDRIKVHSPISQACIPKTVQDKYRRTLMSSSDTDDGGYTFTYPTLDLPYQGRTGNNDRKYTSGTNPKQIHPAESRGRVQRPGESQDGDIPAHDPEYNTKAPLFSRPSTSPPSRDSETPQTPGTPRTPPEEEEESDPFTTPPDFLTQTHTAPSPTQPHAQPSRHTCQDTSKTTPCTVCLGQTFANLFQPGTDPQGQRPIRHRNLINYQGSEFAQEGSEDKGQHQGQSEPKGSGTKRANQAPDKASQQGKGVHGGIEDEDPGGPGYFAIPHRQRGRAASVGSQHRSGRFSPTRRQPQPDSNQSSSAGQSGDSGPPRNRKDEHGMTTRSKGKVPPVPWCAAPGWRDRDRGKKKEDKDKKN